jgi:hypothetical protein
VRELVIKELTTAYCSAVYSLTLRPEGLGNSSLTLRPEELGNSESHALVFLLITLSFTHPIQGCRRDFWHGVHNWHMQQAI